MAGVRAAHLHESPTADGRTRHRLPDGHEHVAAQPVARRRVALRPRERVPPTRLCPGRPERRRAVRRPDVRLDRGRSTFGRRVRHGHDSPLRLRWPVSRTPRWGVRSGPHAEAEPGHAGSRCVMRAQRHRSSAAPVPPVPPGRPGGLAPAAPGAGSLRASGRCPPAGCADAAGRRAHGAPHPENRVR